MKNSYSSIDLAMAMLPCRFMEAGGIGVESMSAALNLEEARPIPSMAEDWADRNLDATFKGLGVAGDIAYCWRPRHDGYGCRLIPGVPDSRWA